MFIIATRCLGCQNELGYHNTCDIIQELMGLKCWYQHKLKHKSYRGLQLQE